jgi:hypothetical protein
LPLPSVYPIAIGLKLDLFNFSKPFDLRSAAADSVKTTKDSGLEVHGGTVIRIKLNQFRCTDIDNMVGGPLMN